MFLNLCVLLNLYFYLNLKYQKYFHLYKNIQFTTIITQIIIFKVNFSFFLNIISFFIKQIKRYYYL